MSFGITIVNKSQNVLIDSDSQFAIFYCRDTTDISVSSGTAISSLLASGQLIFARPSGNSGTITYNSYGGSIGAPGIVTNSTGGSILYRRMESVLDGVTNSRFAVPTSGYGLNVFNASNQCIFAASSSNFNISFDIIVSGTWPVQYIQPAKPTSITMPLPQYALSNNKTYVLLNTCNSIKDFSEINQWEVFNEYRFEPSLGQYGTIKLTSYKRRLNSLDPDTGEPSYSYYPNIMGTSYMIAYLRST